MSSMAPIRAAVGAVRRRVRLQRSLDAGALLLLAGLGVAGVVLAFGKAGWLSEGEVIRWLLASGALPLLGALVGALRPIPRLVAAQMLDRSHALRSRVASALEFAQLPEGERTPFMRAAIGDALSHAPGLSPARAMPLRAPRDLVACAGLAIGVGVLGVFEVPDRVRVPVPPQLAPLLLHQDDLLAFRGGLDELMNNRENADEVREVARDFNQLMEDLADRRLDRTEALRRIRDLERRLAEGRSADAESLRDALRELGNEMRRADLTRAASDALRDGDAGRAEQAMRELAESLRQEAPSRAELDRLRQALERAAEHQTPDQAEELERQRQEMQRLLQRQQKQQVGERERRLLERRRRELERLERQQQEHEQQRRQLERLQRELQRAAEDLNRNQRDQAADSLERGAEDLNRMARQQLSEEQMRQLEQQLRQLRELMRRQQQAQNGQGGQNGQGRMDRFVLRAQGQGDGQGVPLRMPGGQQGQGGQNGQGQEQGGPQQGQGGQMTLAPGQGNAQLELPGMGQQPGQGGEGSDRADEGPGIGVGHDPTMLDDPTSLDASRQNTRVEGEDGDGPSRSEVILSAADRGFASRGYRNVYTNYRDHAEEVLETDEIPAGYRFYVRRYFQLIRPREGNE